MTSTKRRKGMKGNRGRKKVPKGAGRKSKTAATGRISGSIPHRKKYFPWNHLPRELRVKVLQNLCRKDLARCRLLDRETLQLIRCNRWWKKKRVIDYVRIQVVSPELFTSEHFASPSSSPYNPLRRALKNADVHHLNILEMRPKLTDEILRQTMSCVVGMGCRVENLTITGTSLSTVTPSTLLRFLRGIAPTSVTFHKIDHGFHRHSSLNAEVLEFIVTRQKFYVSCREDDRLPIDDNILTKLTASEFFIGHNRITINGLKSFVERLANGEHSVVRGEIFTDFSLIGLLFLPVPNVKLVVRNRQSFHGGAESSKIDVTAAKCPCTPELRSPEKWQCCQRLKLSP